MEELEVELSRLAGDAGDWGFYWGPDGLVGHWRAVGRVQRSRTAASAEELAAILKELT